MKRGSEIFLPRGRSLRNEVCLVVVASQFACRPRLCRQFDKVSTGSTGRSVTSTTYSTDIHSSAPSGKSEMLTLYPRLFTSSCGPPHREPWESVRTLRTAISTARGHNFTCSFFSTLLNTQFLSQPLKSEYFRNPRSLA
jgi:hypothetical protein